MSDWKVGDLAVCVHKEPCHDDLEIGRIYEVMAVEVINGQLGLGLVGTIPLAWKSWLFRKIRPDKHEPCEAEFITLLKRSKVKA